MTSANLNIYQTQKNIKSAYNNNKFKVSAPNWNDKFNLPDGSYSISGIRDYFEYFVKKHETITDNPLVQIYTNKIKNRIVFQIKTGYKLELSQQRDHQEEQKKMLLIVKMKDMYQNQILLTMFQCIVIQSITIINKQSKVLLTFIPNKQFGQLINMSPHSLTMLNITNIEFLFTEVCFIDQNNKPLEIKGYEFLSFAKIFGDKYGKN